MSSYVCGERLPVQLIGSRMERVAPLRSDECFLLLESGLRAVRRPALMQAEWPKRNRLLELIEGTQFAEVVGA